MSLNGFDARQHIFVCQGAFEFLQELDSTQYFDLAVVDPPTFSNSARTEEIWEVQKDYAALLNHLARHMVAGGIVFFSNNFRKFVMDESQLAQYDCREITAHFSTNFRRFKLDESALEAETIHEISRQTVPDDFRNRRIHRCWKLTRK